MDGLDLTGSIVSPDAMGTHTTIIVEHIVDTSKKRKRLGWHLNKATINIYQRTFKRHLQDNIFALLYPGKYTLAIVARKKDKPSFKKSYSRQP